MKNEVDKKAQTLGNNTPDACASFIEDQKRIVAHMIRYYCQRHHSTKGSQLCPHCEEMKQYAFLRLSKCPFQDQKPNCSQCKVHCYTPKMRQQIRDVMRYSGMRMIFYAPKDAMVYIFRKIKWSFCSKKTK